MTARPPVRGEDPQKPGEPTARKHPSGPEPPVPTPAPATGRDERPDDSGRSSDTRDDAVRSR